MGPSCRALNVLSLVILCFNFRTLDAFFSNRPAVRSGSLQWVKPRNYNEKRVRAEGEQKISSINDESGGFNWKVGNVYEDLDRLEQAINLGNAEQNLKHKERIEMLEHFAKSRHELFPAVRKYVIAPLVIALGLRFMQYNRITSYAAGLVTSIFDFHFWTISVASPILLLLAKRLASPRQEPMPDDMKGLDPEYLSFITVKWESPETSCKDYVRFMLEYWNSAIIGMAIVGILATLKVIPRSPIVYLWWNFAVFLTRIAAIASLYQFPKQMFELQRAGQPRPIGIFPTLMNALVQNMLILAPAAVASDLSKILAEMQKGALISLYTTISTLLFGTWLRLQHSDHLAFRKLDRRPFFGQMVYAVAVASFWKKPVSNLSYKLKTEIFPNLRSRFHSSKMLASAALFSIVCVGLTPILLPLMHLFSIPKIFRVVYTHNLPLSLETSAFQQAVENETDMAQRMKWRYRLEWRESQRLKQVYKSWKQGWGYWLLAKGSVTEKLALELREEQKRAEMQGMRIWDRLRDDLASTPDDTPMPNRDLWKKDAMKQIAEKHQADYDRGTFEDPLGVAVQQTFGIGLGFNFEHMNELKRGEEPSIRRLQARAAKSAIKRVQELYDAEAARKELEGISDPGEREKKARELRDRTDKEKEYLAKRLTELVPAGLSDEFESATNIKQFRHKQKFVKTSSHEYVMEDPFAYETSTERLFSDLQLSNTAYKVNKKNDIASDEGQETPGDETEAGSVPKNIHGEHEDDGMDNILGENDDEFIEAYLQQQQQQSPKDGDDVDDDDGTKMMLA